MNDAGTELTAVGRIVAWVRVHTRREPTQEAVDALTGLIPRGDDRWPFVRQFVALILLSSSIAAFGLLADSAGVVIGAMLVAPLMTPILAASAATVRAENRELAVAVAIIGVGTVCAIAVGGVVSALAADAVSSSGLPTEVTARTFPGLLDLGIAVTAGAAAGYITPRQSALGALPGVGIAVALVPPLSAVGITWQLGETEAAKNAMLLYLTNLAAIIFAASVMLIIGGFRPHARVSRKMLATRVSITLAAVAVVAVPLTLHTVATIDDTRLKRATLDAVEQWDPAVEIVRIHAGVVGDVAEVELLLTGPNEAKQMWTLAERIRESYGGPVDLDVQYSRDQRFRLSTR